MSQFAIGQFYHDGTDRSQAELSDETTVKWLLPAAAGGHLNAMNHLGLMHRQWPRSDKGSQQRHQMVSAGG